MNLARAREKMPAGLSMVNEATRSRVLESKATTSSPV